MDTLGNKRPTLKVLNKLVKKPATYKWYDLGIELLEVEDLHALDEIHKNYPRDVGMCCTKMLQLWLERQPDASWEQLLQALKKVEMNELASTIEQEFLSVNRVNDCPDDKYLNEYVRGKVCAAGANKWRDLGIVLMGQDAVPSLDVIRLIYPNDVEECCSIMFTRWRQRTPTASWKQLIEALKEVELTQLASELELLLTAELESLKEQITFVPKHPFFKRDTRLQYLDTHMAMIAAYKWRDLGAKLLEKGMLDVIEADHPHDTVGCCKHVFRKWLEITPDASCDQLISALRSPTVQLDYLADQLEERWGIKLSTSTSGSLDYGSSSSDSMAVTDCPTIKQINLHVRDEVCTAGTNKWWDLGKALMGEKAVPNLNAIGINHPNDVQECCTRMFTEWCQRTPEASWKQLIEALKENKLSQLASKLEKLLEPAKEHFLKRPTEEHCKKPTEEHWWFIKPTEEHLNKPIEEHLLKKPREHRKRPTEEQWLKNPTEEHLLKKPKEHHKKPTEEQWLKKPIEEHLLKKPKKHHKKPTEEQWLKKPTEEHLLKKPKEHHKKPTEEQWLKKPTKLSLTSEQQQLTHQQKVSLNLKENLTCPFCYQLYKNPKFLPCHHSYCEECLKKIMLKSKIICPECTCISVVPAGGVKDLPDNFFINRIMDKLALNRNMDDTELQCGECIESEPVVAYCVHCKSNLCQFCCENHKRSKRFLSHSIASLINEKSNKNVTIEPKAMALMCKEHDLELLLFCKTCEQLVCKHCVTKGHHGHDYANARMKVCKCQIELEKVTTSAAAEEAQNTADKTKKKTKKDSLTADEDSVLAYIIPVSGPHQINCDGQSGGYFVWDDCGLEINFPPRCSQQHIQVTTSTFLPIKNKVHPGMHIVSAVYQFNCNIRRFDKPFTLRLQHCIEVESLEDCQKIRFIIQRDDSNDVKHGHFEVGKSYGTVNLHRFSRVFIVWINELWRNICTCILPVTHQDNTSLQVSNIRQSNIIPRSYSTLHTDHRAPSQSASGQQYDSLVPSVASCDTGKEHTKIKHASSPVYKYESMIGLPKDYCQLTDWSCVYSIYVKLGGWGKVSKESILKEGAITNFPVNYYANEIEFDTDGVAMIKWYEKAPEPLIDVNCWPNQIKKEDVDEIHEHYVDKCGKDPLCINYDNILSAAVRKSVIRVTKTLHAPSSNCQLMIKGIKPHQQVDLCQSCFTNLTLVDTIYSRSTTDVKGGPVLVATGLKENNLNIDISPRLRQSGKLNTKPKMWDLINIVSPQLKAEWETVAYTLHYDTPTIDSIKALHQKDPQYPQSYQ